MKNLFFLFAVVALLSSCNSRSSSEAKSNLEFKKEVLNKLSWETEKLSPYMLVSPIEFNEGFKDIYGFPVRINQWYLVSIHSRYSMMPVQIEGDPNLIEHIILFNNAVLDTVAGINLVPQSMSSSLIVSPITHIKKLSILCVVPEVEVLPDISQGKIIAKWKIKDY